VGGPITPFLNAAALTTDPLKRMKYVIVSSFAFIHYCHKWIKPLNPIIGETY
jgi:hypothetical protein